MNTIAKVLIGAAALGACAPAVVSAQVVVREPTRLGVQVNYGNDSKFGIGFRVRHSLRSLFPSTPLSGIGSLDVFFPGSGVTWFDFNYNAVYNFTHRSAPKVAPYAGAGLNLAVASGNGHTASELGVNVVGGASFPSTHSNVTPFLELRGVIGNAGQLVLTGGIYF